MGMTRQRPARQASKGARAACLEARGQRLNLLDVADEVVGQVQDAQLRQRGQAVQLGDVVVRQPQLLQRAGHRLEPLDARDVVARQRQNLEPAGARAAGQDGATDAAAPARPQGAHESRPARLVIFTIRFVLSARCLRARGAPHVNTARRGLHTATPRVARSPGGGTHLHFFSVPSVASSFSMGGTRPHSSTWRAAARRGQHGRALMRRCVSCAPFPPPRRPRPWRPRTA